MWCRKHLVPAIAPSTRCRNTTRLHSSLFWNVTMTRNCLSDKDDRGDGFQRVEISVKV